MATDFMGKRLHPGDDVVYSSARNGRITLRVRKVQRIEDDKVFLVPEEYSYSHGWVDVPAKRSTAAVNNHRLVKVNM